MRRSTTLTVVCTATVLLAGLLGACGDSDTPTTAAPSVGASTTTAPGTTPSEPSTESSTPSSGAEATTFCSDMAAFDDGGMFDDLDGSSTESAKQGLELILSTARAVDVPSEIAAEWDVVVGNLDVAIDALDGLDLSDPADQEAFADRMSELGDAEVDEASDRIDDFMDVHCVS